MKDGGYDDGSVLDDILAERVRQGAKWGPQRHLPDLVWRTILGEEAGEADEEILEALATDGRDPALLGQEVVQIAAVAIAWIEAIDARRSVLES